MFQYCVLFSFPTVPPSPPLNTVILTDDFRIENFSILLTWDSQEQSTYFIMIDTGNATVAPYSNTSTYIFNGEYNTAVRVNISAMNCAGNSEKLTLEVYEGE